MRRRLPAFIAAFVPLFGAGATAFATPPPAPPISGVVRHLEQPIAGALVIFYNLGDTTLTRSRSAPDGTFVLATAPVGVYDLIAYKRGFLPALVRLWHQALPEPVLTVDIKLPAACRPPVAAFTPSSSPDPCDPPTGPVLR